MKRRINIFSSLIFGLLIISLALLIVYSYNGRKDPEYVSGIGPFKFMHMITGSMNPVLNIGDIIVTKNVDTRNLKTGDIITFRTPSNILVTHRIMGIKDDGSFITKGDANIMEDVDLRVNMENILGKYFFKIPKGAYLIEFFQSFKATLLLLFLIILLQRSNTEHIMYYRQRERSKI